MPHGAKVSVMRYKACVLNMISQHKHISFHRAATSQYVYATADSETHLQTTSALIVCFYGTQHERADTQWTGCYRVR